MEQTVNSADINKGTIVGEVFDNTVANLPLFNSGKGLITNLAALFFKNYPTGKDNIATFAVQLENPESGCLTDITVEIAARTEIYLRGRKEGRKADVNSKTTFYFADNLAFNCSASQPTSCSALRLERIRCPLAVSPLWKRTYTLSPG